MAPPEQRERFWSSVAQTLAAFAVFLMVLVPQGTMVARDGDQVFIAICTGHGPLTVQAAGDLAAGKKSPLDKKTSDTSCAFAGHAPSAPTPTLAALSEPQPSTTPEAALEPASSPAPGRGLAAPPPPSRGPPSILI